MIVILVLLYLLGVVLFYRTLNLVDDGATPIDDFLLSWVWPFIAVLIIVIAGWNLIIQRR